MPDLLSLEYSPIEAAHIDRISHGLYIVITSHSFLADQNRVKQEALEAW